MFSSLPDYRRFAELALPRLRKDNEREPSNRLGSMMLNVVLLAGLWGVPLYARWIVLSDLSLSSNLAAEILGKWRIGDASYLEFTAHHQLRLIVNETLKETAHYRIIGDVLEVSRFTLQPENRTLEINQQNYRVSIHGNQLAATAADVGFTPIPEHAQEERSGLRKVLPPWHGPIIRFRRADNR